MKQQRIKTTGLALVSLGLAVVAAVGVKAGARPLLGQVLGESTQIAQVPTGTSFLPSGSGEAATVLSPLFQINIPTLFTDTATLLSLIVEEESVFNGQTRFLDEVILENGAALGGDLTAEGADIDVGSGTVTASNLVYSVLAGSGITVSGDQNITVTNSDKGSDQKIFKSIKVGSDTASAGSNTDTFEFAAGDGISLSLNTTDKKMTLTASNLSGWYKASSSNVALITSTNNVGIGTSSPSNKLEVDSGADGETGVSFTRVNSSTSAGIGGGKVLSVDSGGRIILVQDQTGDNATPSAEAVLPTATSGMTLYFNGTNWAASNNLFHDGGSVGISTTSPTSRFQVNTNLASKIGAIIQGYTSQTANLQEWRDSTGSILSYIDASGVFNGSANVSGSLNPGLTTGSVLFQSASGIAQDNSNFFWDDTNKRLGIGTSGPVQKLEVKNGNIQVNSDAGVSGNFYLYKNGALVSRFGTDASNSIAQISTYGTADLFFTPASGRDVVFYGGGGTEIMRVDTSTNNVGIGTTTLTATAKLHVNGGYGANDAFTVNQTLGGNILSASASGTTKLVLSNAGKLGIGLAAPSATLHVTPPNSSDFAFRSTSDDGTAVLSTQWRNTAIGYGSVPSSSIALTIGSSGTESSILTKMNTGQATRKGLVIAGYTSQSANLLEFQDISSNVLSVFDEAGNLGIGTSNPTTTLHVVTAGAGSPDFLLEDSAGGAQLEVKGSGANNSTLKLTRATNYWTFLLDAVTADDLQISYNGSEKVRIDSSSGYVGIGTTVPGQLLHVESNQNAPTIALVKNTTNGTNGRAGVSAETASSKVISMQAVSSGMTTVPGWANTGVVYTDTAALQLVSGDTAGYMTFTTGNAQTSGYERMRISSGGQISIGTTTATALLHVNGGYGANDAFTVNQTLSGNILSASASGATKLVLTNGGNLGIGTTSPSSLLTVHGDIRVSSTSAGIYAGQEGDLYLQGAGANIFHNGQNWIQPYYNSSYNTAFFTPFGPTDPRMVIASSGNVGVGTTNPTSKLHVSSAITSSSTVPGISFSGYSTDTLNTGVLMNLQHTTAGDKGMSALLLIDNQNTAEVSDAGLKISSVTPGSSTFGIQIGIDVSDSDIQDYAMEIGGNSIHGTSLLLDGNGASYLNGGNLGIGTTNPGTALDIYTSSTSRLMLSSSTFDLISSNSSATPFEINHLGGAALIADIQDGSSSVFAISDGGNVGIGTTTFGTSAGKVLALAGSTAPSSSITDGIQLFAVDVTGSHELQVRDEAGNVTTLSPHNFSQIEDGKSEDLAWSFYSERNGLAINADMTKALRLVEKLSGEKLVYIKNLTNGADLSEFYADQAQTDLVTDTAAWLTRAELSPLANWSTELWTFIGKVIFEKPAEFLAEVTFKARVNFTDADTAGLVVMKANSTVAHVTFDKEFATKPAITLTPQNTFVRATVSDLTTKGFTVRLESPQTEDIEIIWTSVSVTNIKRTESDPISSPVITPVPTVSPTTSPSPSPTPFPSSSPEVAGTETTASDSAELTP